MVVGGVVPVRASTLQTRAPIVIVGDGNFTATNGVIGGNGTASNPYLIEGWDIAELTVSNTNAYVVIRNVYIHSGVVTSFERVVDFLAVSNVEVENVTVSDSVGADGVFLVVLSVRRSSDVAISQSNIISDMHSEGVVVSGSVDVSISGNIISNANPGVLIIEGSDHITVSGNIISGNGSGVEMIRNGAGKVIVSDNRVESNLVGILGNRSGGNLTVVRNEVRSNGYTGIGMVSLGTISTILDNDVDNNGWQLFRDYGSYGVGISAPDHAVIIGNTLSNNPIGLEAGDNPSGAGCIITMIGCIGTMDKVYHNNFLNNLVQATLPHPCDCPCFCPTFSLDNGYPSAGNFWSDYHGVDNCSGLNQNVCLAPDGIGDTPVVIAPTTIDHYPLMKPFAPTVSGTIRFQPASIASQSAGGYLKALVRLPIGFNRSNLIPSSIRLNDKLAALAVAPLNQPSGAAVLVVTFNLTQVRSLLSNPGNYVLNVTGNLLTSTNFRPFQAAATVRVFAI